MPQINPLTVIIAASIGYAAGALWQAPFLFGRLWLRHHPADAPSLRRSSGVMTIMLGMLAASLQAALLDWLYTVLDVGSPAYGLSLAVILWLAIFGMPQVMNAYTRGHTLERLFVDISQQLVVLFSIALVMLVMKTAGT